MHGWFRIFAIFFALPAAGFAQDHGAAGGRSTATAGEDADAAAVHRRFFANPRSYRLTDGRRLIVAPFRTPGAAAAQLRILDVGSGRIVGVTSIALDALSAADGESFRLGDHGNRIEWRRGPTTIVGTLNAAMASEDVEFANGEITLSGRLTRAGVGRRPAIILAHGGGPGDRNFFYYGLLAGHFAERGFVVLTYDKRGVGLSRGGSWQQSTVREIGADLSAAVRYLAARPDIDPRRIGIFGVSQGGWLGPVAASETGKVAFLALFSAPPVDTWAQELNEARSDLAAGNFTPEQTEAALAAMRTMFAAAESGAPTRELGAAVAAARDQPWARVVELSGNAANLVNLRRTRFDPGPLIERLRAPVYLAYGGADLITPYRDYIPVWRAALARAGATDVTIRVHPGANHGLLSNAGGSPAMTFAPGVLEGLTRWVEVRGGLRPPDRSREPAALEQAEAVLRAPSLAGAYATRDGTVVVGEIHGNLFLQDFERGRLTSLHPDPASRTAFMGIGLEQGSGTTPARMRFLRNGRLVISETGRADRSARRIDLRESAVAYGSGALSQQGILVLPAGRGPFPAVLFLHGDGPGTRHNFLSWARLFAASGIAALSIDKRGYGGSEGDGLSATLQDNADDAAAAIAYLASRSDISPGRIGMIGTSRGGWTAPMAAVRRPDDIAFIVASSGGPIGVGDQERYSRLRSAAAADASEVARRRAAQVIDDYFVYLASEGRERREAVRENWTRYGEQPWYRAMRMPAADPTVGPWPPARRVFAGDLRLDAEALYDQVRVPVLFLYGAEDALFPVEQVVAAARRVARRLPGSDVRIFEGANHGFGLPAGPGDVSLTAPGYYETLVRWSRERLFAVRAGVPGAGRNAGRRHGSGGSGR